LEGDRQGKNGGGVAHLRNESEGEGRGANGGGSRGDLCEEGGVCGWGFPREGRKKENEEKGRRQRASREESGGKIVIGLGRAEAE